MLDSVITPESLSTLESEAHQWLLSRPALPLPGRGQTLERWRALADIGAHDLCLAKVLEAHYDALAILAELGEPAPADDTVLAVWAAEGPQATLRPGTGADTLDGDKPWCSGASLVDAALVTVREDGACQLYQVGTGPHLQPHGDSWPATGMGRIPSVTVRFANAPARRVGQVDAYLQRPGFWHGGAGVAAVWYGAAMALVDAMQQSSGGETRDRLLGEATLAMVPAAALMRELAVMIDADPANPHREAVVRVRSVVERACTRVLDLAGRALGPAPMCTDRDHARRWADLTVFLRQSHADRDWCWLGEQARADEWSRPWAL